MKKLLETGQFRERLQAIDLYLLENDRTIPDWFYRQVWRPKTVKVAQSPEFKGLTLIVSDALGLGPWLSAKIPQPWVLVSAGKGFEKIDDSHYILTPENSDHYQQLWESIEVKETPIARIVHLSYYQDYPGEIPDLETLEQSQNRGVYSLLSLVQTLEKAQGTKQQVQLLVVGSYTQFVQPTDKIACEKSPVLGLLKTLPQEMPWLHGSHLDLPVGNVEVNGDCIWQELCNIYPVPEVAYREGKRSISGLEKIDFVWQPQQELPFKTGGIYLLSGGLGGIGIEIAKYLLENYQAKLLLTGRTPLRETEDREEAVELTEKQATKLQYYQLLQKLPGRAIYRAVDVCNLAELRQVVTQTLEEFGSDKLDGIIHLAGVYQEKLLTSETPESIAAVLRPKVLGTRALHQLLEDNAEGLFVHFSSIYGFFGATALGAYSIANSFLPAFSHYQTTHSNLKTYCLSWSMWEETGMSQGYQMKELSRTKGYYTIGRSPALSSFLAALSHPPAPILIGLDGSKPPIQKLTGDCQNLQQLTAYFTAKTPEIDVSQWGGLEVGDRFGTPTKILPSAFIQLEEFPVTTSGKIDRKRLQFPETRGAGTEQPETETEQKIAEVWREVLQIETVGLHDNFFELGGKSILLVQVHSKLQDLFNTNLKVVDLLTYPTIHSLSQFMAGHAENQTTQKSQESYDKRLQKRLAKTERGSARKRQRSRKS